MLCCSASLFSVCFTVSASFLAVVWMMSVSPTIAGVLRTAPGLAELMGHCEGRLKASRRRWPVDVLCWCLPSDSLRIAVLLGLVMGWHACSMQGVC